MMLSSAVGFLEMGISSIVVVHLESDAAARSRTAADVTASEVMGVVNTDVTTVVDLHLQ